jgi:hypothetical protein
MPVRFCRLGFSSCGEFQLVSHIMPTFGEFINSPFVSRVTWTGELTEMVQYSGQVKRCVIKRAQSCAMYLWLWKGSGGSEWHEWTLDWVGTAIMGAQGAVSVSRNHC